MWITGEQFNEILNLFGLSLRVENGDAIFVDTKTNMPFKSYMVKTSGEKEYITNAKELLAGWPCYLKSDTKFIVLEVIEGSLHGMDHTEENVQVRSIDVDVTKEDGTSERNVLTGRDLEGLTFDVSEQHYDKKGNTTSFERFGVAKPEDEISLGNIQYRSGPKWSSLTFNVNPFDGEVEPSLKNKGNEEMSVQELTDKVDNSMTFKKIVNIIYPDIVETFDNTKSSSVNHTR